MLYFILFLVPYFYQNSLFSISTRSSVAFVTYLVWYSDKLRYQSLYKQVYRFQKDSDLSLCKVFFSVNFCSKMSWILLFFGVIWRFCKISSQWCFVLFQYISCLFTSKTSLNSGYSLYHNPSLPSCCKSFETSLEIWWNLVFCYQNCSDPLWEKIALVIEKNVWN